MTSESKVYIAGVGYSPSPGGSHANGVISSLVSAATKALLDAGVTYDDVSQGLRSRKLDHRSKAFRTFDEGGITVDEVESGSELESSFRLIRDRGAQCVLMIAVEKSAAVAFVLVSDNFLGTHPYLKDSSVLLREPNAARSNAENQAGEGILDICKMVWALRGWSNPQDAAGRDKPLYYKGKSSQRFELSRADAQAIPKWKEVEHKQDGKHRLGYNPATETKDISQEDFEAVRAIGNKHNEADSSTQFERRGGDRAALAKL